MTPQREDGGAIMARELPILFRGDLVRKILDGEKTQTRRPVKPQPRTGDWFKARCPFGQPGDFLYVRETWHQCPHCADRILAYRAGGWMDTLNGEINDTDDRPLGRKCTAHGWRPSIHMPKWAARLWLQVTEVRVERVREISHQDCIAEGVPKMPTGNYPTPPGDPVSHSKFGERAEFARLWESAYPGSWERNDWVWVISFEKTEVAE